MSFPVVDRAGIVFFAYSRLVVSKGELLAKSESLMGVVLTVDQIYQLAPRPCSLA